MERNRNSRAIWGKKVSTPPTPAITPSTNRELTQGATPAAVRAPSTHPANQSPTSVSTPSERREPKGPKVSANIASIIRRKTGMAKYLLVTMESI